VSARPGHSEHTSDAARHVGHGFLVLVRVRRRGRIGSCPVASGSPPSLLPHPPAVQAGGKRTRQRLTAAG
jgi:hypothetical protein